MYVNVCRLAAHANAAAAAAFPFTNEVTMPPTALLGEQGIRQGRFGRA